MKIKAGLIEGAIEVKKKINTDIKAAVMLIVAEDIVALRNVIRTVIKSISKSVGVNEGSILPGSKKKT
jgi:tRNA threonylcarbamoyladenosine modification (KEOPS) complex  Pcc1 subunit